MLNRIKNSYQKITEVTGKSRINFIKQPNNLRSLDCHQVNRILSDVCDGIIILDNNYNIVLFNKVASEITGYKQEEAIGFKYDKVLKFYHDNKLEVDDSILERIKKTNKEKKMSNLTVLEKKNKDNVSIAGKINLLKNLKDDITGFVIVFKDITKESEIDTIKTEFVSLVSHQLRTPLTAIRWFIEELYGEELGKLNSDQKDYLQQVMESNKRMIKLVNDLLDVSRLEASRIKIEPVLTDMLKLTESVIAEYVSLAKANNCEVIIEEIRGKLPKIKIDQSLIREVLGNLISNAIKYSYGKKGKKKVFVRIEKNYKYMQFSVKDFGIGVPKKFKNRLFQKFFRADNVVTIDTEGTGFGLYISKLLVEASGGKIWFKSEENIGSTFFFTLPLSGSKARSGEKGLVSQEENY